MPKRQYDRPDYLFTEVDRKILEATQDDIELFCEHYFDIEPMPWQSYFYHAPQKQKIVVAGIRSGKTFGASIGFLHYATFNPWTRIANASISLDQAKIVYYSALDLASKKNFEKFVKDTVKHPFPRIVMVNGAEMWFRSVGYEAELWRGQEFDWINVDEGAYIPHVATIATLQGRLLGKNPMTNRYRDGVFTITTSPRGRGWLQEMWRKGDANYPEADLEHFLSLRVRTLDNPHLNPAQVELLLANYTERQRQQELEGMFLDPEDAVFSWESISATSDAEQREEVRDLLKQIDALEEGTSKQFSQNDYQRFQLPPQPGRAYICSWDIGTTATRHLGRNATVLFVLDITERPWRVVAYRRETQGSYPMIIQWIKEYDGIYKNQGRSQCWTVIDATGSGQVVQQILQDEHGLDVEGLTYSMATKPEVITAGQVALDNRWLIAPPIRAMMDEFSGYEMDDKKIVQDCVMSLCQGLYHARMRVGDYNRGLTGEVLPTRSDSHPMMIEGVWAERRRRSQRIGANNRSRRSNWE